MDPSSNLSSSGSGIPSADDMRAKYRRSFGGPERASRESREEASQQASQEGERGVPVDRPRSFSTSDSYDPQRRPSALVSAAALGAGIVIGALISFGFATATGSSIMSSESSSSVPSVESGTALCSTSKLGQKTVRIALPGRTAVTAVVPQGDQIVGYEWNLPKQTEVMALSTQEIAALPTCA